MTNIPLTLLLHAAADAADDAAARGANLQQCFIGSLISSWQIENSAVL